MKDEPLKKCPECGKEVKRLLSKLRANVSKSNSELRNLGFQKLVRRDKGVYEDVTRKDGDDSIIDVN